MPRAQKKWADDAPKVQSYGEIQITFNSEMARANGKKETYHIPTFSTYANIKGQIDLLVNLRANCLPEDCVITNVQLKRIPNQQWSLDVFDGIMYGRYKSDLFPVDKRDQKFTLALGEKNDAGEVVDSEFKLEDMLAPNSPADGLCYKLQNQKEGVHNIKILTGISDLFVANFENLSKKVKWLEGTIPQPGANGEVATVAPDPNLAINVQRLMTWMKTYSKVIRRMPNLPDGTPQFFAGDIDLVVYNWVSNVKPGGPSGRLVGKR